MRVLVLVALLGLAGCRAPSPPGPIAEAQIAVMQRRMDTLWLDLQLIRALERRGATGDALRRVQLAQRRRPLPGMLGCFVFPEQIEQHRVGLTNKPLELSRRLIDLEPPPPGRCCDQPQLIHTIRRD